MQILAIATAIAVVCALHPIPNQGARHCGDLFSVALNRYLHMKQQTLAMAADQDSGFEQPRKPTRREEFLQAMDAIVPWAALCQVI